MKFFELTLDGFDGGTDETDHLIKWVLAPNRDRLDEWIKLTGLARLVKSVDTNDNYNALTFSDGIDVVISVDHNLQLVAETLTNSFPGIQWRIQVTKQLDLVSEV